MPITNEVLYAQSWNTNFGSNPFDDGPSEYSQNTEDTEYIPIQTPDENRPPSPGSSKNSEGSPVEQTTGPNDNHEKEKPQQIIEDDQSTRKTEKDSLDRGIQKTPEIPQHNPSQEEPINTRGDKYNLRPNPNPNYSDTYR